MFWGCKLHYSSKLQSKFTEIIYRFITSTLMLVVVVYIYFFMLLCWNLSSIFTKHMSDVFGWVEIYIFPKYLPSHDCLFKKFSILFWANVELFCLSFSTKHWWNSPRHSYAALCTRDENAEIFFKQFKIRFDVLVIKKLFVNSYHHTYVWISKWSFLDFKNFRLLWKEEEKFKSFPRWDDFMITFTIKYSWN